MCTPSGFAIREAEVVTLQSFPALVKIKAAVPCAQSAYCGLVVLSHSGDHCCFGDPGGGDGGQVGSHQKFLGAARIGSLCAHINKLCLLICVLDHYLCKDCVNIAEFLRRRLCQNFADGHDQGSARHGIAITHRNRSCLGVVVERDADQCVLGNFQ